MTPDEKTLLLAVSEGLYKLLKERLDRAGLQAVEAEAFGPFRALIDAVKEQNNEGNA